MFPDNLIRRWIDSGLVYQCLSPYLFSSQLCLPYGLLAQVMVFGWVSHDKAGCASKKGLCTVAVMFFFLHSHHSACICKSLLSWQLQWLIFHWFKCKEVMFDLENPFNKFFIQLMLSQTVSNAHFYMTWQQVYFKTWITSNIKWKKFLSPKKP